MRSTGYKSFLASNPFTSPRLSKSWKKEFSALTIKQHLAALRMLVDWLVIGHVVEVNPAHAVRGTKHVVRKGKTPVLSPEEIRQLLDSIEAETLMGLGDRALIALMTTFARVGAALKMRVEDYFIQGRRSWVRLQGKAARNTRCPGLVNFNFSDDEPPLCWCCKATSISTVDIDFLNGATGRSEIYSR